MMHVSGLYSDLELLMWKVYRYTIQQHVANTCWDPAPPGSSLMRQGPHVYARFDLYRFDLYRFDFFPIRRLSSSLHKVRAGSAPRGGVSRPCGGGACVLPPPVLRALPPCAASSRRGGRSVVAAACAESSGSSAEGGVSSIGVSSWGVSSWGISSLGGYPPLRPA